jgi:predicted nucleic acid-binding protein
VARVALDAGLLIAFLDPGDAQHERAVHAAWLAAAWASRCRELSVMI